jgi:hypothetical protein
MRAPSAATGHFSDLYKIQTKNLIEVPKLGQPNYRNVPDQFMLQVLLPYSGDGTVFQLCPGSSPSQVPVGTVQNDGNVYFPISTEDVTKEEVRATVDSNVKAIQQHSMPFALRPNRSRPNWLS